MTTTRAMPALEVPDVPNSAAFYRRAGFASHGTWGEPPSFCIVQRGDVSLALQQPGSGAPAINSWWSADIHMTDAAALSAELEGKELEVSALERLEYDLQDFDLIAPDGHRIAFGSDLSPAARGPGLGPNTGRG